VSPARRHYETAGGGVTSAPPSHNDSEGRDLPDMTEPSLTERWHAYYSEKRITHQWLQLDLVGRLKVKRVLEVGPYYGLVTAMLANAGYEVTTLDIGPPMSSLGATAHIAADLTALDPERIRGFDAILCCETLEHLAWSKVDGVLAAFAASRVPYLVLSVPYEGAQIAWNFYANAHAIRHRMHTRWFRFLQKFKVASETDIDAHKWEIGYKGYSLAALTEKVSANGWRPVERRFTDGCRSVFLVCRNASADQAPRPK
jgi:SAM-dependent methyltransferase